MNTGWAAQIQLRRARAALEAATAAQAPPAPPAPPAPSSAPATTAIDRTVAELGVEVAQAVLEHLPHNVD